MHRLVWYYQWIRLRCYHISLSDFQFTSKKYAEYLQREKNLTFEETQKIKHLLNTLAISHPKRALQRTDEIVNLSLVRQYNKRVKR